MHPWQLLPVIFIALPASAEPPPLPSKETLEFLAEWQDVDDDTFQLLLENGIRDAAQPPEKEENSHD